MQPVTSNKACQWPLYVIWQLFACSILHCTSGEADKAQNSARSVQNYQKPVISALIKAWVGSMMATDYAWILSDCIHFYSYIIRRPTDAIRVVFHTHGHSNGPQHMSWTRPKSTKFSAGQVCTAPAESYIGGPDRILPRQRVFFRSVIYFYS